jgi:hypothetical protein
MDALPAGSLVRTTASMRKKTAVISIRVLPELKQSLEQLAKADRRPLASYLELVLEQHVTQSGARNRAASGKSAGTKT